MTPAHDDPAPDDRVIADLSDAQLTRLLAEHEPSDPARRLESAAVQAMLHSPDAHGMVVLAADSRASTCLMKEALGQWELASILSSFVSASREACCETGAWYDKFLGDGFLCYWLETDVPLEFLVTVLDVAATLHDSFGTTLMDDLRANTRNVPSRAGLSIGIDAGLAHVVRVANDFTAMGHQVVGAMRMVGAAKPGETLVNTMLGCPLFDLCATEPLASRSVIERLTRATKEYPDGQEAYRVTPRAARPGETAVLARQ